MKSDFKDKKYSKVKKSCNLPTTNLNNGDQSSQLKQKSQTFGRSKKKDFC